jgi:hypothetical protein
MTATLQKWLKDKADKRIGDYLSRRCDEDSGLAEDMKDRTWKGCNEYIRYYAKKEAVSGMAMVDSDTVFEWIEDYCRGKEIPQPKTPDKKAEKTPNKSAKTPTKPTKKPIVIEMPTQVAFSDLFDDDDEGLF